MRAIVTIATVTAPMSWQLGPVDSAVNSVTAEEALARGAIRGSDGRIRPYFAAMAFAALERAREQHERAA